MKIQTLLKSLSSISEQIDLQTKSTMKYKARIMFTTLNGLNLPIWDGYITKEFYDKYKDRVGQTIDDDISFENDIKEK